MKSVNHHLFERTPPFSGSGTPSSLVRSPDPRIAEAVKDALSQNSSLPPAKWRRGETASPMMLPQAVAAVPEEVICCAEEVSVPPAPQNTPVASRANTPVKHSPQITPQSRPNNVRGNLQVVKPSRSNSQEVCSFANVQGDQKIN